jgi:hypothetical protein
LFDAVSVSSHPGFLTVLALSLSMRKGLKASVLALTICSVLGLMAVALNSEQVKFPEAMEARGGRRRVRCWENP